MKLFLCTTVFVLLSSIIFSCNGGKIDEDTIMDDYFIVEILMPSYEAQKKISEELFNYSHILSKYSNDSLIIECEAIWNVSSNENPSLIKIIEIDTTLFVISDSSKIFLDWDRPSDRPVLQIVKSILDTATFSLICVNHDEVTPQSIMDSYFDSIANTVVSFIVKP